MTPTPVTDPEVLALFGQQTGAAPQGGAPVTDPSVLAAFSPPSFWAGMNPFNPEAARARSQSGADRAGPLGGMAQGVYDVGAGGLGLLAHGLRAFAPEGSALAGWTNEKIAALDRANQAQEKRYRNEWRQGNVPEPDWSRLGGQALATLPVGAAAGAIAPGAGLAGRIATGATAGAVSNALSPVGAQPTEGDYWGQVGRNTALGAGVGAAAPVVLGAAGRVLYPNAVARNEELISRGVTPTIGQALGGAPNRIEQGLTSLPGAGDFIKAARGRPIEQAYRGALNDALAPIGETLAPGTKSGPEAMREMYSKVSGAYRDLLPQVTAQADQPFLQDFTKIYQNSKLLAPDRAQQFDKLVTGQVLNKFSPAAQMSGETFKGVDEVLGKEASTYMRASGDPDARKYGQAIRDLQQSLRNMLERNNPDQAEALQAANESWKRMLPLERAASYTGTDEGIFSPAHLLRAVQSTTPGRKFAQGGGVGQPYATAAKRVLGSTLPDSGTPYRGFAGLSGLAATGGALGIPFGLGPEGMVAGMGLGLGSAALYSSPMQRLLTGAVTQRPDSWAAVAQGLRDLTPYAGSTFGSLAPPNRY